MEDKGKVAAWITCTDLIIKAKNELITEAIKAMHKEIEEKRMAVQGNVMPMTSETSSENEEDMFLLTNLLKEEPNIKARYNSFIKEQEGNADTQTKERIDELKKFLVAVEKISILMLYGKVFNEWFDDASMQVKAKDPAQIFAITIHDYHGTLRLDAIKFVLSDQTFRKNKIFTEEEYSVLERAAYLSENQ